MENKSIKYDRYSFIIYFESKENDVVLEFNEIIRNDPILRKYRLDLYRQIFKGTFCITIYHQYKFLQVIFALMFCEEKFESCQIHILDVSYTWLYSNAIINSMQKGKNISYFKINYRSQSQCSSQFWLILRIMYSIILW